MGVDIDTFQPLPNVSGYSTYGGYSGQSVKPIGLRCGSQIAAKVKLPIHGLGGISDYKDAIEYFCQLLRGSSLHSRDA